MILAIESSCDESALALFNPKVGLTRELISSQAAQHQKYGGVVPDLASRMHLSALPLLLESFQADLPHVTQIAVTRGPGLLPCLSLGVSMARALALSLRCPLVGINHLRAHAHSPFIPLHREAPDHFLQNREALLPHLGLIVSGGNTLLIEINTSLQLTILGRTVDDAAGEAFDKGAKLLGLPYPGGALIEQLAQKGSVAKFNFPRGIPEKADLRFSFSGLKTALRYQLETMSDTEVATELPNLCASYQEAILGQLLAKTQAALNRQRYRSLGLSGGVANNQTLRTQLTKLAHQAGVKMLTAEAAHCGDNAGMIAFAAWCETSLPTDDAVTPAPALLIDAL